MLGCPRCKRGFSIIEHFVYKSSKDKMTKVGVCKECWGKARSLKVPYKNLGAKR
jgi:hypothetical protein